MTSKALTFALNHFQTQQNGRKVIQGKLENMELFIQVFPPPPRLVIIGAVHIAIPLVSMAKLQGFHTTVIDPRKAFATLERFPHTDELITKWPDEALANLPLDEGTYFVTLSHDDKLDVPALKIALQHPVHYIGALGSRKTHAKRVEALIHDGADPEKIGRIHTPVGLDIGAVHPQEIALAVMAEIVAVRRGRI
jgi:xanthine dehydrogenase accessory factor